MTESGRLLPKMKGGGGDRCSASLAGVGSPAASDSPCPAAQRPGHALAKMDKVCTMYVCTMCGKGMDKVYTRYGQSVH